MLKPKKDKLLWRAIKVVFWDHAKDTSEPIRCRALGWVINEDDLKLVLTDWDTDQGMEDSMANWEVTTILKSTVIDIYTLRSYKWSGKV